MNRQREPRDEPIAAAVVEHLAPTMLNRELGPRLVRDAQDESGLLVDFTYEDAVPPVALEVTGLHVVQERELAGAIDSRLEPILSDMASREGLGAWILTLRVDAKVKDLVHEIPDLMRAGESFRPGEYTSDELMALGSLERDVFLSRHRRFKALGLVEIENVGSENGVRCIAFGSGSEISGFSDRLALEVARNATKLGQAAPRESHLAVLSYDLLASRLPTKTAPPELPSQVDYLWVIHSWPETPGLVEVWLAARGESSWRRAQVESGVISSQSAG